MERSTSKKDPEVASRSTPEQQDGADSEFVELDDIPMKKVRSIPEKNEEICLKHSRPQSELRRSIMTTRAPEIYFPSLHYWLLTGNGEPEYSEEALQVKAKDNWELTMDDEIVS